VSSETTVFMLPQSIESSLEAWGSRDLLSNLGRTELATILACALAAAVATTASVSLAAETSEVALQAVGTSTSDARPEDPATEDAKTQQTSERPVTAIYDRAAPTSPPSTSMKTEKSEDPQSTTEAQEPDTATTANEAEERETHPVLVELLKQLTERQKPGLSARQEDIVAIASFYSAETTEPIWTDEGGFADRAKKVTEVIRKADDWGLKAANFDLPNLAASSPTNEVLAAAELKLAVAVLKYVRHARGGRLRPSSVSRLFDQTPEVAEPLGIMKDLASTANAGEYLKRQHPQHPQFELLRQALLKARGAKPTGATTKKNAATIRRILANMERWRWMPRNLGSFYVWDDVPAQKVSVISDRKVLFHEKMVVGKPKTPTPIFSSDMEYIIFHPSWGVPPGMKRNELWPQLRNSNGGWFSSKPSASAVLRSHGLRVTRGGVPVNPDSVNWSKVNISSYHFTQAPGPTNVLGIVKFRFPNKHSVYMHDTPERHLFGDRERAFSHGCMRVQRPVRLAEVLLKHDKGWNKGQVKQKKRRGARIKLSTPIAVHIAYFTVVADENGKLDFRRDLYGLDRRVLSKLEGRNVMVGSLSSKRIKRTSYPKKRRIRRAAKKNKKPFNPFSSVLD